jgi:serine phosphatase RsbU (regulator of sigma subunit)
VELSDSVVDLTPGEAVVPYTDGAIEQRGRDPVADEEDFFEIVASTRGLDAALMVASIEERLKASRPSMSDDLALIFLKVTA